MVLAVGVPPWVGPHPSSPAVGRPCRLPRVLAVGGPPCVGSHTSLPAARPCRLPRVLAVGGPPCVGPYTSSPAVWFCWVSPPHNQPVRSVMPTPSSEPANRRLVPMLSVDPASPIRSGQEHRDGWRLHSSGQKHRDGWRLNAHERAWHPCRVEVAGGGRRYLGSWGFNSYARCDGCWFAAD